MRRVLSASDLVLFAALGALGSWFVLRRPAGFDPASASTLAGAIYGAAALLLGNWINRWNEATRNQSELADKVGKLQALVAARLVHIATALISVKDLVDAAITSQSTAVPSSIFLSQIPEDISITNELGDDRLILDADAIDALVTLESNLEITRRSLEHEQMPMSSLALTRLQSLIVLDLEVLAQCYDRIAPERKFLFEGSEPELAATVLRRKARPLAQRG